MKKQLLNCVFLFLMLNTKAQQQTSIYNKITAVDRDVEILALQEMSMKNHNSYLKAPNTFGNSLSEKPAANNINWSLLCGSMNVSSMLYSHQRPLQYNPSINALSFVHTKSDFYQPSPAVPLAAESGVIVTQISSNWGTSWDSTCLWSNANKWGRFPQGAIFNPNGNTSLSNAYIVGSGVVADTTGFSGAWYASKRLNNFNNIASTDVGAQRYYSSTIVPPATYPPNMPKHSWSHTGFTATDDGYVRTLAVLGNDLKSNNSIRGYAVATGTFDGTSIDWKIDSIIPDAVLKSDGINKHLRHAQMAWNQAGTVGYVVGIGVMNNATLSNRNYQPIIYKIDKTISASSTWTLMTGLDFNSSFKNIASKLASRPVTYPTNTGSVTPFPHTAEFDIAVDVNNNLHLGIVFMSGYSDHVDSLTYYSTFETAINPGQNYTWPHIPGARPYIYDFVGNGTENWKAYLIDSMSSEGPGFVPGTGGYDDNPWDADTSSGLKTPIEPRLQLGRTPDGRFITFSWTESDSAFTWNQFKYNTLPDIKFRSIALSENECSYTINSGHEKNLTISDFNVRTRAALHYMSPIVSTASVSNLNTSHYPDHHIEATFKVPLTVTNSNPYSSFSNNSNWFAAASITQTFHVIYICADIKRNAMSHLNISAFPNPCSSEFILKFETQQNEAFQMTMCNTLGQVVRNENLFLEAGADEIKIDVRNLPRGIYVVNLKAEQGVWSKKVVVE